MADLKEKAALRAAQVEKALVGVEASEDVFKFLETSGQLEKLSRLSHTLFNGLSVTAKVLPIAKLFISGVMLGYESFHSYRKLSTKPATKLRVAGVSVNLSVAVATVTITVAGFFVPALLPVFLVVAGGLGLGREIMSLTKVGYRYAKSQENLVDLYRQMKLADEEKDGETLAAAMTKHQAVALKQVRRRWKIASQGIEVLVGLAAIAAIIVVLAVGPIGWIALGAITVLSLAAKIGFTAVKNYKLKQLTAAETQLKQHLQANDSSEAPQEKENLAPESHLSEGDILKELQDHPRERDLSNEQKLTVQQVRHLAKQEQRDFTPENKNKDLKKTNQVKPQHEDDAEGESDGEHESLKR